MATFERPKLIIFDCDGVLVDSEPLSILVLVETMASLDLPLTASQCYDLFLGRSFASLKRTLRDKFDRELTDQQIEAMRLRLAELYREQLKPIEGIARALKQLTVPYCVASSSVPERIQLALELTGLNRFFGDHVFSATMVTHGKPAPDLFLYAAERMGVAPEHCLVIEDSPAGLEAARAANMRAFAFVGGSHAEPAGLRDMIAAWQPAAILEHMDDLPALLEGFPTTSATAEPDLVIGVDVGTGSARAGVFATDGRLLGRAEHPIAMHQPKPDHAEHDSEDIWAAVGLAVRGAVAAAGADPRHIRGLSFDATCSLVVRDVNARPLSVSTTGEARWDTIVWLDHRAIAEADECTATRHTVLDFVGGTMSPEMETPKLMWLKRHFPERWTQAGYFFDLADYLTWRATGSLERSQCTLGCKWTYMGHGGDTWRSDYLKQIGIGDMLERGKLPEHASPIGKSLGRLTETAARALGLTTATQVGVGLIDAHAGALGVLGGYAGDTDEIGRHLALIAGTSSCIMALSASPKPVPGIWGPYFGAMLPDLWLNEGGQSATGALLDHIIRTHSAGQTADTAMHKRIVARVMELRAAEGLDLAGRLHVLPDFHGNRSPIADPHALGVISGLTLDSSFDGLCKLYWRTCVAIALGLRHVLEALNAKGYVIDTLHVTGGHTKNPLLMELYADATGSTVIEPAAEDAVLLGTAMVAATAAGAFASLTDAAKAMQRGGRRRAPDATARARFDKDYAAFLAMHKHRQELDQIVGP